MAIVMGSSLFHGGSISTTTGLELNNTWGSSICYMSGGRYHSRHVSFIRAAVADDRKRFSPAEEIKHNTWNSNHSSRHVVVRAASDGDVVDDSTKNLSTLSSMWLAMVKFFRGIKPASEVPLPLRKSSCAGPLLMLPSKNHMLNRFYSLEEEIVMSHPKRIGLDPDDSYARIGSSQGWLVYIGRQDLDLLLYNPISHRTIMLPPVDTLLLNSTMPSTRSFFIEKLILSSSPDSQDCIAMCTYGAESRLAFCCLGRDTNKKTDWICLPHDDFKGKYAIAYASHEKLFYCFNTFRELECWDLEDVTSPKGRYLITLEEEEHNPKNRFLYDAGCFYLIADSCTNDLLVVKRFVAKHIRKDGHLFEGHEFWSWAYPYKTLFFEVYKIDLENNVTEYLEDSLNDRVLFVGLNQSFSLYARDFPHLRPNSIYFTDDNICHVRDEAWYSGDPIPPYGGHDVGIFDYQDKSFKSCHYPSDIKNIKRILPTAIWLAPNCLN